MAFGYTSNLLSPRYTSAPAYIFIFCLPENFQTWEFAGGPVVSTSTAGGTGLIPGRGTKILQASCAAWPKKKKKFPNLLS